MLRVEVLSHTNVVMCSRSEVEVEGNGVQMRGKGSAWPSLSGRFLDLSSVSAVGSFYEYISVSLNLFGIF